MRFALISDVHFGPPAHFGGRLRKLTHQAEELCQAFVARMNASEQPELVVNLGDVIEDENRERDMAQYGRFIATLGELRAPVLHVAGNHDQINLSDDDLRTFWRHSGPLHYSRELNGFHFSVLRTVEIQDRAIHLPDEQLSWLRQDLERATLPCIVFMHHPASEMRLDGNRWFEKRPHVCRVSERRAFQQIVSQAGNVIAVFNGHVHWNHFDLVDGIPYITIQSLIENLDDDAPGRAANASAICDVDERRLLIRVDGAETARYQIELKRRS
jgi:3',5'-cyclic AMP phosphodiesterase CpdA